MFELLAEGRTGEPKWRQRLTEGVAVELGRATSLFAVPWDSQVSRRHARLTLHGELLQVDKLEEATNPIFFQGKPNTNFSLKANQRFVIGQTMFSFVPSRAMPTMDAPVPLHERAFSNQFLRDLDYRDAKQRLAMLSRLPILISGAVSDVQLYDSLADFLLAGISRAQSVAIVSREKNKESLDILHWDSRGMLEDTFQPSESLIRRAMNSGQTMLHVWSDSASISSQYTLQQNADWAFVCPLAGDVNTGQAIYVSGKSASPELGGDEELLQDDMKFAQLVGSTYANLRELSHLQQRQASLRSFFSPIVLEAISNQDIDHVLEPRECPVSVLFCDLRGFSATSEIMSEHLLRLLDQVSQALGAITSQILEKRGVVGDFHGDAVMGFWGWPLEQNDAAIRACQVALAIVDQSESLNQATGQPLDHFLMGMGMATGVAVAGKIGTSDQVKVTAFGPVVNLAARFESLTRAFLVPILIDEATANALRPAASDLSIRIRRLAKVLPSGLQRATPIYQVLPDRLPYLHITDDHLQKYDEALNLFEAGEWGPSLNLLRELPYADRAKDVLLDFISFRNAIVPTLWNQVIEFRGK